MGALRGVEGGWGDMGFGTRLLRAGWVVVEAITTSERHSEGEFGGEIARGGSLEEVGWESSRGSVVRSLTGHVSRRGRVSGLARDGRTEIQR